MDWADVGLILHEYGLGELDFEGYGPFEFSARVRGLLVAAADQALLDLLAFLEGGDGDGKVKPHEPLFWRPGTVRVFLSHVGGQRRFASALAEQLETFGVHAFVGT